MDETSFGTKYHQILQVKTCQYMSIFGRLSKRWGKHIGLLDLDHFFTRQSDKQLANALRKCEVLEYKQGVRTAQWRRDHPGGQSRGLPHPRDTDILATCRSRGDGLPERGDVDLSLET